MAQAVCDCSRSILVRLPSIISLISSTENGHLESLSAASLSGVSLSLATGLSQIQQVQRVSGELRGEPDCVEEGESGDKKDGAGEGREAESEVAENKQQENKPHAVPKPGNGAPATTTSPYTSKSEDGVRYLLENIPRVEEEFDVVSKIGEGTFSSVFLGRLKGRADLQFALKHLVPTSSSSRVESELRCLQSMGGKDNVIPLLTCVRHRDHIVLIMPYFPHSKLTDYIHLMTPAEVQCYMRALFTALRNVHSHHVIHRDIKPSNFLYHRDSGRFQLVDFGLAHLAPTTSSKSQSAPSKPDLRPNGPSTQQPTLITPSASSSAHVTTLTQRTPHPQARINGTANLIPPPLQTYRRQVHRKLHSQTSASERGGERRTVRKRGKEEGEVGGHNETRVCPLRHKRTELCNVCQNKANQNAPRAGTPGFRAPEVLLKCPQQTTAVDIWSAGVILLCLLSGRYPFFRASDDLSALAQIIALRGTAECARVSGELGKELVCGQQIDPVDLRKLCRTHRSKLHDHLLTQQQQQQQHNFKNSSEAPHHQPPSKRNRLTSAVGAPPTTSLPCRYKLRSPQTCKISRRTQISHTAPVYSSLSLDTSSSPTSSGCQSGCQSLAGIVASWRDLPEAAFDLLEKCLELNPASRVTAQEALQHPFLADTVR